MPWSVSLEQTGQVPLNRYQRRGENPASFKKHREIDVPVKPASSNLTPEAELESYIDRLDPKHQKLLRSVRAAVRKRFPTANELAYDYSSHVVISYSATDRAIDAILAIDGRSDGVRLYFMHGPQLPDPKRLLQGSGSQARFVPVEAVSQLAHPDVDALFAGAVAQSTLPLRSAGKGSLVIKLTAAKKRSQGEPTQKKAPGPVSKRRKST
ncbi:MAG TPA: hypothetical protein VFL07_18930 [Rudaea sp.]|nr:hypothetical protein [Rudaea sp.]